MTNIKTNDVRAAKREYYREWRKKNPERVAEIQKRFWTRKAAEMRNAAADPERRQTANQD